MSSAYRKHQLSLRPATIPSTRMELTMSNRPRSDRAATCCCREGGPATPVVDAHRAVSRSLLNVPARRADQGCNSGSGSPVIRCWLSGHLNNEMTDNHVTQRTRRGAAYNTDLTGRTSRM
jgi:hypothetical protein